MELSLAAERVRLGVVLLAAARETADPKEKAEEAVAGVAKVAVVAAAVAEAAEAAAVDWVEEEEAEEAAMAAAEDAARKKRRSLHGSDCVPSSGPLDREDRRLRRREGLQMERVGDGHVVLAWATST